MYIVDMLADPDLPPAEPVSVSEAQASGLTAGGEDVVASEPIPTAPVVASDPQLPIPEPVHVIPVVDDAARARAYASVVRKREDRLQKITQIAGVRGTVAHVDIVRRLHVSDATASRYMRALVSRGTLAPEGNGRGSGYSLVV